MESALRTKLAITALLVFILPAVGCWDNDDDKDNVKNQHDLCPDTTPFGAKKMLKGCSATDLILDPSSLAGNTFDTFEALSSVLDERATLPEVSVLLGESSLQLHTALGSIQYGATCQGRDELADAIQSVEAADTAFQDYLIQLEEAILEPEPAEDHADVDEASSQLLLWQLHARRLSETLPVLGRGLQLADGLCKDFTAGLQVEGEIESYESSTRVLKLKSGEEIVMAPNALHEEGLTDGAQVAVDVWKHVNGDLLGQSTQLFPSPFPGLPGLTYDFCIQLRVAPVQPKPLDLVSWLKHDLRGYEYGGVHQLEEGMRIAAYGPNCPGPLEGQGPSGEDVLIKYGFEVELTYKVQGSFWKTTMLASNLGDGSQPVKLPANADPNATATLTARKLKRTCTEDPTPEFPGDFNCPNPTVVDTQTYSVVIRPAYTSCYAAYDQTTFDLEDDDPNDWRPAQVTGVNMTTPGAGSVSFTARGKKIINGTPTSAELGLNQPFAIYSDDPFSVYGTNRESGLTWPHANGSRNGQPFQYACNVPAIVRDAIDFCPGGADTLYRLPFLENGATTVTQGNGGSFTHNGWQWFALDLSGAAGRFLLAARGGTVVDVRSNIVVNCQATPYPGCPRTATTSPSSTRTETSAGIST